MLTPESSREIISSGVTPICCPNRTSFSTTCSKRSRLFHRNPWSACCLWMWGVRCCHVKSPSRRRRKFRSDCLDRPKYTPDLCGRQEGNLIRQLIWHRGGQSGSLES